MEGAEGEADKKGKGGSPMTARQKFKVGDKVEMTKDSVDAQLWPRKVDNSRGVVKKIGPQCHVQIQQQGHKKISWWHIDFWQVVK